MRCQLIALLFVIPSEAKNLLLRLLRDFVHRNDSVKEALQAERYKLFALRY